MFAIVYASPAKSSSSGSILFNFSFAFLYFPPSPSRIFMSASGSAFRVRSRSLFIQDHSVAGDRRLDPVVGRRQVDNVHPERAVQGPRDDRQVSFLRAGHRQVDIETRGRYIFSRQRTEKDDFFDGRIQRPEFTDKALHFGDRTSVVQGKGVALGGLRI